jgi:REP element-mobilizing transposase RayT
MFLRKRNRLPRDAYIGQRWYFVTLNAEDRQQILAGERVANLLLGTLRAACAKHLFNIYAYCLMPDHIHVEALGLASESSLPEFMRSWKGTSTVPLRDLGFNDPLQKSYWDHILRPSDNHDAVA